MARNKVRKGKDFAGELVGTAFNLNRCGPWKKTKSPECWTVFEKPSRARLGTAGKVRGYVPSILLEDVQFYVSQPGVKRIRRQGRRQVIAWVQGIARDPGSAAARRRLGDLQQWRGFTFNPFRDETFVLRDGRKPIEHADWVYFDAKGNAVALTRKKGSYKANGAFPMREVSLDWVANALNRPLPLPRPASAVAASFLAEERPHELIRIIDCRTIEECERYVEENARHSPSGTSFTMMVPERGGSRRDVFPAAAWIVEPGVLHRYGGAR